MSPPLCFDEHSTSAYRSMNPLASNSRLTSSIGIGTETLIFQILIIWNWNYWISRNSSHVSSSVCYFLIVKKEVICEPLLNGLLSCVLPLFLRVQVFYMKYELATLRKFSCLDIDHTAFDLPRWSWLIFKDLDIMIFRSPWEGKSNIKVGERTKTRSFSTTWDESMDSGKLRSYILLSKAFHFVY